MTNRNARALAADSILNRLPENFFDFVFLDIVAVNVRLARAPIDTEAALCPFYATDSSRNAPSRRRVPINRDAGD